VTAEADGFRAGAQLVAHDGTVRAAPPAPPGGERVAPGADGGVDLSRDGAVIEHFDLGVGPCSAPSGDGAIAPVGAGGGGSIVTDTTIATTVPTSCAIGARVAVIDGAGNIYAESGDGSSILRLR
jgi:hypothetical protein